MKRALVLMVCVIPTLAFGQRTLTTASTERRVALVVGNAAYEQASLKNPVNDARAITERLRALGFVVIKRENLRAKEIGGTLREFRSRLSPAATALFYYAGHGVQVNGVNYLPTVDAAIETEEDVPTQSLEVGKVLDLMEAAKTRVNLVFLDACRDNPFARRFRGGPRGLAKVDAASGTLISFATRPGSVAADGNGSNGLYTEHLLKHMSEPGVPIEQVLKRVGAGVKIASRGRQEPWSEGLIDGDFYFRYGAPGAAPAIAVAPDPTAIELSFWEAVRNSKNPDDFKAYLEQYPQGRFAVLARSRLNSSEVASAAPNATPSRTPEYRPAGHVVEAYPQFGYFVFRQSGTEPVGSAVFVRSPAGNMIAMRVEKRRGNLISAIPPNGAGVPSVGTEILVESR